MKASKGLQEFLADFVIRDHRLESHPKVAAACVYLRSINSQIELVAAVSKRPIPIEGRTLSVDNSVAAFVLHRREAVVIPNLGHKIFEPARFVEREMVKSGLSAPIWDGADVLGALFLSSNDANYFRSEDIGRVQLLGALIAFLHARSSEGPTKTEMAARLGRALSGVRIELGLTQDELAYRGGFSRIALSQWERGRWPPSPGPIYQWCAALGLVSGDNEPQVSFLDVTPQLIAFLSDSPRELHDLSPERFEHVIAERIDRMGYDVQLTGATNRRDGGIDLIAVPKIRTVGSFLMAVQVKHHRGDHATGRPEVDRMLAWKDSPFRVGVMVTNTSFSRDARWLADQVGNKAFLRLRDFEDLKRWLKGQFDSEFDWREIPDVISLAPGITVQVPKAAVRNSREIWPLSAVRTMDENGVLVE